MKQKHEILSKYKTQFTAEKKTLHSEAPHLYSLYKLYKPGYFKQLKLIWWIQKIVLNKLKWMTYWLYSKTQIPLKRML